MSLPNLKITGGATGRDTKIMLNGVEIPGLTHFELTITNSDVTRAHMEIGIGSIEVDAQTVTEIIAGFDPAAGVSSLP